MRRNYLFIKQQAKKTDEIEIEMLQEQL